MTLKPKWITVGQLRALLTQFHNDTPVAVEGCDCEGDAIGVVPMSGPEGDYILIARYGGAQDYDEAELVKP